jgi:hypothetical protein
LSRFEDGEEPKHEGRLLDRDLLVAAVASTEGDFPKPRRLFGKDQERELEGFGEACCVRPERLGEGGGGRRLTGLISPGTLPEVPPALGAIRWGRYLRFRSCT